MSMTMSFELGGVLEGLKDLEDSGDKIAAFALYEGAKVVADTINQSAESIQTEPFRYGTYNNKRMPTPEEKAAVMSAHAGIAKFSRAGTTVSTSIGYSNAGYVSLGGKQRPIAAIAASIESGTSFMVKQPYFRKAEGKSKAAAEAAIQKKADAMAEDIKNKHGL